MKKSTSCAAAAIGCVPIGVLTSASGGRRRSTRSMAGRDADNSGRTNGQAEPDRYDGPSAATVGDDRSQRLQEEIEHVQV